MDFSQYAGPSEEWLVIEPTLQPIPDVPLDKLKEAANTGREAVAAKDLQDLKPKLLMQDYTVPTRDSSSIEARTYRPVDIPADKALPVYVHLHGGGFMFGTLASEDAISARIALDSNVMVFNVTYRHTPEFTYPTAWDDVEDAFVWLHANMSKLSGSSEEVVVGGISAGAHLTATPVLGKHLGTMARGLPPIRGQISMTPAVATMHNFDHKLRAQLKNPAYTSYEENENAPIIPVKSVLKRFNDLLQVKDVGPDDLVLFPGNASEKQVRGLPPTVFGIAGLDPLRDEGLLYAKLLAENGVPTDIHLYKGVPHGFKRFGDQLSASKKWDNLIANGILWTLSNPAATGQFDVKVD